MEGSHWQQQSRLETCVFRCCQGTSLQTGQATSDKRTLEKGNVQKYILSSPDRVDHKIGAGDRWKNTAWCDAS